MFFRHEWVGHRQHFDYTQPKIKLKKKKKNQNRENRNNDGRQYRTKQKLNKSIRNTIVSCYVNWSRTLETKTLNNVNSI